MHALLSKAASKHAEAASYTDSFMKPRPMPGPRILYRSVSIPELVDIWSRKAVIGGGNWFNPADPRPHVFFADEIDDRLIRQGEYTDRQAWHAVYDAPRRHRSDLADALIEEQADRIICEMDRDGIPYEADYVWGFQQGWEKRLFRDAVFRCRWAPRWKYIPLFKTYGRLTRERDDLDRQNQADWEAMFGVIDQRVTALPWSSAIVVTRPIDGGLLYSNEFGSSGLGEREYGLRPGAVTLADLTEIILIKAGQQVERVSPQILGSKLALLPPLWTPSPSSTPPFAGRLWRSPLEQNSTVTPR